MDELEPYMLSREVFAYVEFLSPPPQQYVQKLYVNCGGVSGLLAILSCQATVRQAAWALRNLAATRPDLQQEFLAPGGIAALAGLLRDGGQAWQVKVHVACALTALAYAGHDARTKLANDANVIVSLATLLLATDLEVKKHAANALATLGWPLGPYPVVTRTAAAHQLELFPISQLNAVLADDAESLFVKCGAVAAIGLIAQLTGGDIGEDLCCKAISSLAALLIDEAQSWEVKDEAVTALKQLADRLNFDGYTPGPEISSVACSVLRMCSSLILALLDGEAESEVKCEAAWALNALAKWSFDVKVSIATETNAIRSLVAHLATTRAAAWSLSALATEDVDDQGDQDTLDAIRSKIANEENAIDSLVALLAADKPDAAAWALACLAKGDNCTKSMVADKAIDSLVALLDSKLATDGLDALVALKAKLPAARALGTLAVGDDVLIKAKVATPTAIRSLVELLAVDVPDAIGAEPSLKLQLVWEAAEALEMLVLGSTDAVRNEVKAGAIPGLLAVVADESLPDEARRAARSTLQILV